MKTKWYVWLLLLIFAALAITSMVHNSATSDEVTHITSGYSYWTYFDYTFNPEHPPLVKLWATIPLLILRPALNVAPVNYHGDQWAYAKDFLYHSGNDADTLYFWTRMMIVIIGIVLGYYVYRWASELFGWKAGLLSLILYVFDPNIIAHSTIVHTDIPISAALFITVYYFWRFVQKSAHYTPSKLINNRQVIFLGILVGICLAVKFTGLYILFILAILYGIHLFFDSGDILSWKEFANYVEINKERLYSDSGRLGLVFLISIIFLTATYGFIHVGEYFTGFQNVMEQSVTGRGGYLLGMHGTQGWWYYFPVAFAVKTPFATLVLFFAALYFVFKQTMDRKQLRNILFLLVPTALYFLAFIPSKYNIGHRHILPVYPFLFVFISALTVVDVEALGLARWKRLTKYILLFFVALLIVANISIYPYYISFFSTIIGGADNGHKYLLDSNIDWGQGLKETAQWLEDNGHKNEFIRMNYFGNEDPGYRGIAYRQIMCMPTPGVQVISVNRLYDFLNNQHGCVDWFFDYEPIAIVGHVMYIYNIDDPELIEKDALCQQNCVEGCNSRGKLYGDSAYRANDSCLCLCADATNEELGIM